MSFQGWPEEALDFYDGLEVDNSKAYWLAHKEIYETCVLAPMAELLAELEPQHGETKIYRPYRDVRFSKDKSPYKTAIAAHAGDGYIQLSAAGLAAAAVCTAWRRTTSATRGGRGRRERRCGRGDPKLRVLTRARQDSSRARRAATR
jgi:uncharacterized protein (DUF2461 family)